VGADRPQVDRCRALDPSGLGLSVDIVSERVRNFQVTWQRAPLHSQIWVR
jgi:hypothetical protein